MTQSENKGLLLVTGGTGFVGQSVVRRLRLAGWQVRILARRIPADATNYPGVEFAPGNVLDPPSLRIGTEGCAAIIHLVGIIRETRQQSFQQAHVRAVENVLRAATHAGVWRYIHMSALGTREHAASVYHQTKWQGEQLVRESKLVWTIFRPSLIHGPDGEFTAMVRQWHAGKIPPFLFMPFFGGGFWGQKALTRVQPILVSDVAEVFVRALATPASEKQTYELGGPDPMTWPEMLAVFNRLLPPPRRMIAGIPFWLAKGISALPLPGLPFNRDQVIMAGEDSICDLAPVRHDFPGFTPQPLEASARRYIFSPIPYRTAGSGQ
ncbi:MAG: complex I NDUFA9 subunit family protein [Phycisphaerae bacterium]